jgi:mono/diheme cytochrome c family protein
MKSFWLSVAAAIGLAATSGAQTAPMSVAAQGEMVKQYCSGCHNDRLKSGGFSFSKIDLAHPEENAMQVERVIMKLRAGMMPPSGLTRPKDNGLTNLAASLETALDKVAAAHPNPGRPVLHRLNRTEYANSIHDLLGLDVDVNSLLPADNRSQGFDNIADVLTISPTLMEGYIRAAGKISRAAVGDATMSPLVETYHIPQSFSQTAHVDGTPFGTRGGTVVTHVFPADGEYIFKMTFYYSSIGPMFGASQTGEKIEIAIDGERAALMPINPNMKVDDDVRTPPIKITAGPHTVSAAFITRMTGPVEDFVMPFKQSLADLSTGHIPGLTGLPHLRDMGINGPYKATGVSETPSRARVFTCRSGAPAEELPCARKIIGNLAQEAFRGPVSEADMETLLSLYQAERNKKRDFEGGIRIVLQAILSDPEFVFRFERTPNGVAPGANYRLPDLELASRLSFFLWSAPPDAELLKLAEQNKLHDEKTLEAQVRRMMKDPRSETLATNFADQWLHMQNLKDVQPDVFLFPDYDKNLADSMRRETELLFLSVLREDRSVMDLLNADYTFVNERLAQHYGIPNIVGTRFRKIAVADENRRGLLGQGSILTLTSLANRTSPVYRGKWVMDVMLGTPPPTPPPNVPPLKENGEGVKALSVRERQEMHRANEPCASCHKMMDPIGFSLENFDATGAWREKDSGFPIDPAGQLFDGSKVSGPAGLRAAINGHSDAFLRTFTQNLLTYGMGRTLDYYDMPVVRSIDRDAAKNNNRMSVFIMGVVKSTPFQWRKAEESSSAITAQQQ